MGEKTFDMPSTFVSVIAFCIYHTVLQEKKKKIALLILIPTINILAALSLTRPGCWSDQLGCSQAACLTSFEGACEVLF